MFKQFTAFAAAAFMATASFAADVVVAGNLESYGTDGWTSDEIAHAKGSFADSFTFTLGGSADVDYGYTLFTRRGFNLVLNRVTLSGDGVDLKYTGGDLSSLTFSNLTAGTYTLSLLGAANGNNGGKYTVTLGAAPVPEPEALALALAGLGVAGFVARRKQA